MTPQARVFWSGVFMFLVVLGMSVFIALLSKAMEGSWLAIGLTLAFLVGLFLFAYQDERAKRR